MRKLVTDHLLSLDGFCCGPDDEIDWFTFDEESLEFSRQLLRGASMVILGRRTFELFAKYWPTPEARHEEPVISERLTTLPKLVFSRSLVTSTWENTRLVRDPVAGVIRELKQGSGGHLLLCGSPTILATLWKEHLVDELNVRIQPIVLGGGRPLLPQTAERYPLVHRDGRVFRSGVTGLRYEVAALSTSA